MPPARWWAESSISTIRAARVWRRARCLAAWPEPTRARRSRKRSHGRSPPSPERRRPPWAPAERPAPLIHRFHRQVGAPTRMSGAILDGKVAIVTGAGGGIGRALAVALAANGAAIVINDVGVGLDGAGGSAAPAS